METETYLDAVVAEAAALAAAARAAGPDAPVPSCPGWSVRDLAVHTSGAHRWATMIVEGRLTGRPPFDAIPQPGADDDPVAWFEAGVAPLVGLLASTDPSEQAWNFVAGGPAPIGFWARRQAHETAIHRVDAELAAGRVPAVTPPELAADGVDEYLTMITALARRFKGLAGFSASVHLHATDAEGEWTVTFADGSVAVAREHARADVAVRAPASDLDLLLWNRRRAGGLEIFGDASLLDAIGDRVRF